MKNVLDLLYFKFLKDGSLLKDGICGEIIFINISKLEVRSLGGNSFWSVFHFHLDKKKGIIKD